MNPASSSNNYLDDGINLLDYWKVLLKWKRPIVVLVGIVSIASVIISLCLTKTYRATATLMPIGGSRNSGVSMLAGQMGLAGLVGGGSSGLNNQILTILKSRTLAERMIEKYQLWGILYKDAWDSEKKTWKTADPKMQPTMEDAVKSLKGVITFNDDKKTQLIEGSAEFTDPQVTADLVNNYINEMSTYLAEGAFTTAKRNRIFIEEQLERNKAELLESGRELNNFYSANKISNVVPTLDVDVSVTDHVATGNETSSVELLQKKSEEIKTKIVQGVPQQVYLQYLTLRRDILGQINSLLTQQYEMAKIDEAKEDLSFQVIDWARVPVRKFKPQRAKICITAFIMSLFLSIFYAFFREYLEKMKLQK